MLEEILQEGVYYRVLKDIKGKTSEGHENIIPKDSVVTYYNLPGNNTTMHYLFREDTEEGEYSTSVLNESRYAYNIEEYLKLLGPTRILQNVPYSYYL